jgi:hypothetical protein
MSESFCVNLNFSGLVVLEKRILNDPTLILHLCAKSGQNCGIGDEM